MVIEMFKYDLELILMVRFSNDSVGFGKRQGIWFDRTFSRWLRNTSIVRRLAT